jgi:hypothetical protein
VERGANGGDVQNSHQVIVVVRQRRLYLCDIDGA